MKDFDVVLTNPPFGNKKGGERANRDDFTFQTSNKQLNFLQHIYRSLKADGNARAAVVIPDIPSEKGIKNTFTTVVNAISNFLSTMWNTIKSVAEATYRV